MHVALVYQLALHSGFINVKLRTAFKRNYTSQHVSHFMLAS